MASATRIIKKYPNRRLYDTETSNYITLAEVKNLVLNNTDFQVIDAKTHQDITRSILLQIILEEEGGCNVPMFSSEMLAQIIRFYGNAMQGVMGTYLERSIRAFIELQQKLQEQARTLYGETPQYNPGVWEQFLKNQGQGIPGVMGSYLEQSANMFLEMQEQMRRQAMNLFGGFPYPKPESTDSGESEPQEAQTRDKEGKKDQ